MTGVLVRCRKCGKVMERERVDYDHIHWKCECGFGSKTPFTTLTKKVNPYESTFYHPVLDIEGEGVFTLKGDDDRKAELLSIEEITAIASSSGRLEDILNRIVRKIAHRLGVEVCSLYLYRNRKLVLAATWGLAKSLVGNLTLRLGEGITGAAAKNREILVLEDAQSDERYKFIPGSGEEKYRGMISCPILDGDRLVGVLNVQTKARRKFDEFEISYIKIVSSLVKYSLKARAKKR